MLKAYYYSIHIRVHYWLHTELCMAYERYFNTVYAYLMVSALILVISCASSNVQPRPRMRNDASRRSSTGAVLR